METLDKIDADETVLWAGGPARPRWLPSYILAAGLAALGLGLAALGRVEGAPVVCIAFSLLAPVLFLLLAPVALAAVVHGLSLHVFTRYYITTSRVITQRGIVARRRAEVRLADVRALDMRQGALERLLGMGTVRIGTAATGGMEIALKWIARLAEVLALVRRAVATAGSAPRAAELDGRGPRR